MSSSKPWNVHHMVEGTQKPTPNPDQITVYNMRFCPFAERTILVLLAKGVPFDVININLTKKPEWFLEQTLGTVPVVLHKDNIILESDITSDYIDELYPESKQTSSDPIQKAMDRVLVTKYAKMVGSFYKTLFATEADVRASHFKDVCAGMEKMNAELQRRGTPFFGGSKPGMVDWMVWPWYERFACLLDLDSSFSFPTGTTLDAWIKSMWNTEPVKRYGLSKELHAEFYAEYRKPEKNCNYDLLVNKE